MRQRTEAARAAAAIRAEIKKSMPGATCAYGIRVTSDNFAGGDSVSVNMTDAKPSIKKAVEALAARYREGTFDGMTDSYSYDNRDRSIPQVKYVSVSNSMSRELAARIKAKLAADFGISDPSDENEWLTKFHTWSDAAVWREFCAEEDIERRLAA